VARRLGAGGSRRCPITRAGAARTRNFTTFRQIGGVGVRHDAVRVYAFKLAMAVALRVCRAHGSRNPEFGSKLGEFAAFNMGCILRQTRPAFA
jgi:hypothetical protein